LLRPGRQADWSGEILVSGGDIARTIQTGAGCFNGKAVLEYQALACRDTLKRELQRDRLSALRLHQVKFL